MNHSKRERTYGLYLEHMKGMGNSVKRVINAFQQFEDLTRLSFRAPCRKACNIQKHYSLKHWKNKLKACVSHQSQIQVVVLLA